MTFSSLLTILVMAIIVGGLLTGGLAGGATSSFAASSLHPRIKVLTVSDKDVVRSGELQTIYVAVVGVNGKPIAHSAVSAIVFFGKNSEKKFSGITRDDGTWSFSWKIEKHSRTGLMGVDIKAAPDGYETGYGSLVFRYKYYVVE
jgi:hypothetical protein